MALGDSVDSPRDDPLIFVSDTSAEAERLMSALRNRGYVVVDVPLPMLAGRVAVQRPGLILCDVDAPQALDHVRRLRDVPGGGQVDLIFLGEAGRTLAELKDDVFHEASGFFVRPVDTFGLLRKVEALIGPPSAQSIRQNAGGTSSRPPAKPSSGPPPASSKPSGPPSTGSKPSGPPSTGSKPSGPPSVTSSIPVPGPSSLPVPALSSLPPARSGSGAPSSAPDASEGPPSLPPPIPLGFGAGTDGAAPGRNIPQSEMSPELENLLARFEQRLVATTTGSLRPPGAPRMSPEDEVDAVLPNDVLAALDEPLDVEDEEREEGTGGGSSTGGSARTGYGTSSGTGAGSLGSAAGAMGTGVGGGAGSGPTSLGGVTAVGFTPGRTSAGPNVPSRPPSSASPELDQDAAPRTPPAAPTRPPTSPGWPAPAVEPVAVEPKPASSVERDGPPTVAVRPTPLPPAPTPEGIRLARLPESEIATVFPEPSISDAIPEPPPRPPAPREPASMPEIPAVLGPGDAARGIARAVRARFSGAIAFENEAGMRRIVLRDGDFVTAASGAGTESLVSFLAERGVLTPEAVRTLGHKLPAFGRHAGAALIAHGHLRQDELWPVLRAHAEWLVGRVITMSSGAASLETEIPPRLAAEPAVFGGATGAEVFLEIVRRVVTPEEAIGRLGGPRARLVAGGATTLLGECALADAELELVNRAKSNTLEATLGTADKALASVLFALVALGVLEAVGAAPAAAPEPKPGPGRYDAIDEQAIRARILARKALVDEGDYFALLGLTRAATSYDVQRAFTELRHEFEPSRILTAGTADLRPEVSAICEVLEEAFEILSDQLRRDRYRRALEASP